MNWLKKFFKRSAAQPTPTFEPVDESMCNFTPRAQQVLALSRKEADRFHHNFVGTEHLLLGLIRLGQGTATTVLVNMGLDLASVRAEVEKQVGTGPDQKVLGNIPYTPRVKRVLALAVTEARALNHTYVGTEHLLLGMLREGDGVAARVLRHFDVDVEKTRVEILKELDPNSLHTSESPMPESSVAGSRPDVVDTTKRYDVYCRGKDQELVVYRNVLFKGVRRLLNTGPYDFQSEFLELEQSNGQSFFLSRFSVLRFCEHGGEITGEIVQ